MKWLFSFLETIVQSLLTFSWLSGQCVEKMSMKTAQSWILPPPFFHHKSIHLSCYCVIGMALHSNAIWWNKTEMTDDSVLPWGRDWPRISRSGSTILGPTWYLVCCIRISATTFVDVVVMSINQLDASTTVTTATTTTMVVPYMSQYHYVQPDDALWDEMRKSGKIRCRFHGCDDMLPLLCIKEQERKECPHVCMSCRYSLERTAGWLVATWRKGLCFGQGVGVGRSMPLDAHAVGFGPCPRTCLGIPTRTMRRHTLHIVMDVFPLWWRYCDPVPVSSAATMFGCPCMPRRKHSQQSLMQPWFFPRWYCGSMCCGKNMRLVCVRIRYWDPQ